MSLGLTLLDELDYVQAPMIGSEYALQGTSVSIAQSISVAGSSRTITLHAPYFTRTLGPNDLGQAWVPFCNELHRHAIPTFSRVDALASIPAASIPVRWSGRAVDEPFKLDELATANLFEITCHDRVRRRWHWPSEIAPDRIDGLLRSVREAAGGGTPIGVNLPLGCHLHDMQCCLSADVDFICLTSRFAKFEARDLLSLVQCRRLAGQLNRPQLPLLVTAPIVNIEQAHKLLALGASAVSIDDILRPVIAQDLQPSEKEVPIVDLRRKLPSIALGISSSANKLIELPQVEKLLTRAQRLLVERLTSVGAADLIGFTAECLRSCSKRAERLTGALRLEHIDEMARPEH